jgi:hypothetical protein
MRSWFFLNSRPPDYGSAPFIFKVLVLKDGIKRLVR